MVGRLDDTEPGATADPGPVAGLPWVTRIAEYSAGTMPAARISLGIPFYGMRWEAADPAVWDDGEASPHVSFDDNGRKTELWFENARSLEAKMELAHRMGFRGISAWAIGQEDPAFWDALDRWTVRHPRHAPARGSLAERSRRAARAL